MSRDKQISEMAKVLNECCNEYDVNGRHIRNKCNPYDCEYWSDDNHCCCSYNTKEATALYNAGYRKSEEVAREFRQRMNEKMGKHTHLLGKEYVQRIMREIEKEFSEVENG